MCINAFVKETGFVPQWTPTNLDPWNEATPVLRLLQNIPKYDSQCKFTPGMRPPLKWGHPYFDRSQGWEGVHCIHDTLDFLSIKHPTKEWESLCTLDKTASVQWTKFQSDYWLYWTREDDFLVMHGLKNLGCPFIEVSVYSYELAAYIVFPKLSTHCHVCATNPHLGLAFGWTLSVSQLHQLWLPWGILVLRLWGASHLQLWGGILQKI